MAQNKSFRYHPSNNGYNFERNDITVRNRTKDYWYAYRKVNGVQRTYYLGKTKNLDYNKLQDAVNELSLSDPQYHKLIDDRKAGVQANVYTTSQATKEPFDLQEKYNQLLEENEELKKNLAATKEVIQVTREVTDNIIPSKSNMIRGTALIKLRDKLNSI